MTNLSPKLENRCEGYYGEYQYAIRILIPFAYSLRDCRLRTVSREQMNERIAARIHLLCNTKSLFFKVKWLSKIENLSVPELQDLIFEYYQVLISLENIKLKITVDYAMVYTNDLSIVSMFPNDADISIRESNIILPPNSIYRKRSNHKYRLYFSNTIANQGLHDSVLNFLKTYEKHIRPSLSLKTWASFKSSLMIQKYFFFDLNDPNMQFMFSLVAPSIRTKLVRIISDNEFNDKKNHKYNK